MWRWSKSAASSSKRVFLARFEIHRHESNDARATNPSCGFGMTVIVIALFCCASSATWVSLAAPFDKWILRRKCSSIVDRKSDACAPESFRATAELRGILAKERRYGYYCELRPTGVDPVGQHSKTCPQGDSQNLQFEFSEAFPSSFPLSIELTIPWRNAILGR